MNVASQIGKNPIGPAGSRTAERMHSSERAQSRRMLFALILLMIAIAVVAFRDRQFLFESEPVLGHQPAQAIQTSQAQIPDREVQNSSLVPQTAEPVQSQASAKTASAVTQTAQQSKIQAVEPKSLTTRPTTSKAAGVGQKHLGAGPSAAKVTAQAAQRAHVADISVQDPNAALYPRLDQRTKVEGSVELQALVGTDGSIQELHVLRGPAVLGSAAREAVLQWKFKPFTENGVAVETYARITVNFTIRVVDGSQKTVASVQPEHVIILADNYQR